MQYYRLWILIVMCLCSGTVWGQVPPNHVLNLGKTTVVPDHYLRGYDPITVFFDQYTFDAEQQKKFGARAGAPLNHPEALIALEPKHPGEFRWLDAKTLQFLPTLPWPALMRYSLDLGTQQHPLVTLMAVPQQITPRDGSQNLNPIQSMTLSFAQRINIQTLARMLTFEVNDLPGVGAADPFWLTHRDFVLKEQERAKLNDPALYLLTFRKPIPFGKKVDMRIQLSLSPDLQGSVAHYSFSTKPLFRLTAMGCASNSLYPVALQGSVYSVEQAIDCKNSSVLDLNFSDRLDSVSLEAIKRMVRFEPAVKNFSYRVSGNRIKLEFQAQKNTTYRVRLLDEPLLDQTGRTLAPFGKAEFHFYLLKEKPYLRWLSNQGAMERFGPQKFPMEGRGDEQVDLRVFKLDPLDRNFWPFPKGGVSLDETRRPPGPGEEPEFTENLPQHIQLLGSPLVSQLVPLPMANNTGKLKFGLDLKDAFTQISGPEQGGTYLVGYRRVGRDTQRHYVRIQVTNLSLSTVEEENGIFFIVTSLDTATPVQGAKIVVEGSQHYANQESPWKTMIEGTTNEQGVFHYRHQAPIKLMGIKRVSAQHGNDTLVLDASKPPESFANNHWQRRNSWMNWLDKEPQEKKEKARRKVHLFTERPIYRPEEPVHLKGYLRLRKQGDLSLEASRKRILRVRGPGGKRWSYPVVLNEVGSFYLKFDEKDLPTGHYSAELYDEESRSSLGSVSFQKESYRIPRFEVDLNGPNKVPSDQPFDLTMVAQYYAGGRVAGQSVQWKVTQFPYVFRAPQYPGFLFATDSRFSAGKPFRGSGTTFHQDMTDANGSATLTLDPSTASDGQPRRYAVEATVTGADEQTVTATKGVVALPPFVLGMKLERFLKDSQVIKPEILLLNHEGKPLADKSIRLRLFHRQWHSYLQETDFTTGATKYHNEVVDEPILETTLQSGKEAFLHELPVEEAGVYVVEVATADHLGRLQKVSADLYVAGDTPVAWKKPKMRVFETALDKNRYNPGEDAQLLLKSPFQDAMAFVVVEGPKGNEYHWVPIENGQGVFTLPIRSDMTPRVPIHTLLMRGRIPGTADRNTFEDRAKPVTMANTTWVNVHSLGNRLQVAVNHSKQVLPGSKLKMEVELKTPDGMPINGEVTLWLVDRAVLALGKEARLDPVPSFIDPVRSHLSMRDFRNEIIGDIPLEELPGGDGAMMEMAFANGNSDNGVIVTSPPMARAMKEMRRVLDEVTVRKNFKTVAYFNPNVQVKNGVAHVEIEMPDNLTEFAVRAVATDGQERFGFTRSDVKVRLPVIVQPALPRFVRSGDQFIGGGLARIVEGNSGPGQIEVEVDGLKLEGPSQEHRSLIKNRVEPLFYPMTVTRQSSLGPDEAKVTVRMAVQRLTDQASDAFELKIPIKPDRTRIRQELFAPLKATEPLAFPTPEEPMRVGSVEQSALVTYEPALVKMVAALDYLSEYPHDNTENQISKVLPDLLLSGLLDSMGLEERRSRLDDAIQETLLSLENALGDNGLYSYWPGGDGQVTLTAYAVKFLKLVQEQGYSFESKLLSRPLTALREALRSDYSHFVNGESYNERVRALLTLAQAGMEVDGYARELAIRANNQDLSSRAQVLRTFLKQNEVSPQLMSQMRDDLWSNVIFKLRNGQEAFHELNYQRIIWGGLVPYSQNQTLAEVAHTLFLDSPQSPKVRLMLDELVNLGQGDGWGNTQATVAALQTLGTVLQIPPPRSQGHQLQLRFGDQTEVLNTSGQVLSQASRYSSLPGTIALQSGAKDDLPQVRLTLSYMPERSGDQVLQKNEGFVVSRELEVYPEKGTIPFKVPVDPSTPAELEIGSIVEEHLRVINPEDRNFVAIRAPFAAGFEPMNPNLATASEDAQPVGKFTRKPDYALYEDDQVTFYFNTLPKGHYDFYFRLRPSFEGHYTHPSATAEMMYQQSTRGRSNGTRVLIKGK